MRRPDTYLGDYQPGGTIYRPDFESVLEKVSTSTGLLGIQRYEALQACVLWGIQGRQPDLALKAYRAYLQYGLPWESAQIDSGQNALETATDHYQEARYNARESGQIPEDGELPFYDDFEVEQIKLLHSSTENIQSSGEAFRNEAFPKIISGLVTGNRTDSAYRFLAERRRVHNFRGYPREIEPKECVVSHVQVAEALVDPDNDFQGNRDQAFRDTLTFAMAHARFPQFGTVSLMPFFGPVRTQMLERGMEDPFEVFRTSVERMHQNGRFMQGNPEFVFDGLARYAAELNKNGEHDELQRFISDPRWPASISGGFAYVLRNSSMPRALAWLTPSIDQDDVNVSASDAFQDQPVAGLFLLQSLVEKSGTGTDDTSLIN